MIMVVTGTDDPTADLVEAELARRGVGHVRCDLSDFPQRLILAAQLDDNGQWTGEI